MYVCRYVCMYVYIEILLLSKYHNLLTATFGFEGSPKAFGDISAHISQGCLECKVRSAFKIRTFAADKSPKP